MADLDIVGSAGVDVVPLVPNFHTKLKALVLPVADKVGEEAGKRMGEAISKNIVIAIPDAINAGGKAGVRAAGKQGDDAGGAFARSIRRKLEAAFKAMPKLDVKLSDEGVDAELARIRAKLEQLSNKRIGIDVTAEAAEAEITRLEEKLRELGAQHPNVQVRADTATARAALEEIRAEIAAVGGRKTVALEVDGAFGAKLRAVVAEAQASLPDINVDADTSPARAEIQALRAQLATLADTRVGIDIDAATATAKIDEIRAKLDLLALRSPEIDVRVDSAAAAAQLAALNAMAGADHTYRVDTSGASSALIGLGVQMLALTAIPLGPALAAGVGAIAAAATAAGAGIGALALASMPAIKGVTAALSAKTAAEKESTTATADGGKAANQAASKALQMAGAQHTLAAAHRNAAKSITAAIRQVSDAERAVGEAVQRSADQRRQSAEDIARAEQSLADAHRNVTRAQQSLTDAQAAGRQAEADLAQARTNAVRTLQALNDQLRDGELDQRSASLRVRQAQQDLAATMADPRTTDLQRAQSQLTLDQALQAQKEQAKSYDDLKQSAEAQRKAGVEGNAGVKAALDSVAKAQRNVVDQTQALGDAQRNVVDQTQAVADAQLKASRAQVAAAQAVSDAQRGVSDAVANAADAQVAASDSIASAERGIQSARLASVTSTGKAVTKTNEFRKALAKLTPAQRDLYDSIAGPKGIKQAFSDWSKALQPQVLPLFVRGINSAKSTLPSLTPLVTAASKAVGNLMTAASAQVKNPFWQGFKKDIQTSAQPAIEGLGRAFGNILKGMAGIVDAFLPHMGGIVKESDRVTGRFAKWGSSLKGSPGFEKFLAYVKSTAPGLASFLGDVMRAALDLSKALAPLSQTMFKVLSPILDALSWIATNAPGAVQILWGLYTVTKLLRLATLAFGAAMVIYNAGIVLGTLLTEGWTAAIIAANAAFEMNPVVAVITIIIVALVALVAGIMYAWNHWAWFRTSVIAVWDAIKVAAMFVWTTVLKPTFDAIWWALQKVGAAAMWLWTNAISPAFSFIGKAAKILFTALVVVALTPIILTFKLVATVAMWLWKSQIKPAFDGIAAGARWLYAKAIKPAFDGIAAAARWLYNNAIKPAMHSVVKSFTDVGAVAKWLWNNVISPVFGWISGKAHWLYDKGVKQPFKDIMSAVAAVARSFGVSKDNIKKAWDQVASVAKKPVKFIVDHVYNEAILPLWNNVAKITGAKTLNPLKIAGYSTGGVHGVRPGYTPGRDNQIIAVGGGEAIMRPEWTRAIGADRINSWNAAARSGGVGGVQRAISAGMPAFSNGGIVDWFKDKGRAVGDFVSGAADALNPSKLFGQASKAIGSMMDPIRKNPWSKELAKLPVKMLSGLKDQALGWLTGGGGDGGANVARGLAWAKTQNGKPYQWGGNGNPSWDCSGFMSAIESVIRGQAPHRRWATGAFSGNTAPAGWVHNLAAPFQIGVTNKGVGHTAGTIAGVNVESRAGGIHVGKSARGAHDPYFDGVYGFRPSIGSAGSATAVGPAQTAARQMLGEFGWGDSQWAPLKQLWQHESGWRTTARNSSSGAYGIPQALPPSKMASAGPDWLTNASTQIKWGLGYIKHRPDYGSPAAAWEKWQSRSPHWYDHGGYLQPGLNLVANGTGQPEPVFTSGQWDDIRAAKSSAGTAPQLHADVRVYVGDREITDIVDTRIELHDTSTATAINTGRWV